MTERNDENREQQEEKHEVGLYEKLAARTAELLEGGKKSFDEALKKAKEEITRATDYTREQADKIGNYLRRDLLHKMGDYIVKKRDAMSKAIELDRMAAGLHSAFARILASAAETLTEWAEKSEKQLEFKTGEVTSIGTLTCKSCHSEIHMKSTARIPPCPKCKNTIFRKSY